MALVFFELMALVSLVSYPGSHHEHHHRACQERDELHMPFAAHVSDPSSPLNSVPKREIVLLVRLVRMPAEKIA